MIYFITNEPYESYTDGIEAESIDFCIDYLESKSELGVDTETTGFDPYINKILTLQVGDSENQFVIDVGSVNIKRFKHILESKTIILHNAKFDLRFLYVNGIIPYKNIFDTYLAERILSTGIDSHRKGLGACVERYFKVRLNKKDRGLIHKLGIFNPRIIKYSAEDVTYLTDLKAVQERKLKELNLTIAANLDNQFVCVLAYIEYCGVYLDANGWVEKCEIDYSNLKRNEEILNEFVINEFKSSKYVNGPDLFNPNFTCKINWNSPQQVIPMLESLGIDCTVYDKGEIKKSLESSVLTPQKDVHSIVPIFLEFQKAKKLVSTYGYDFLQHINPKTNRVHTNFTQIMNTGRLSSGGQGTVNMQNIPAGKERNYFKSEPSNVCVVADYSGQETRVLAEFANDNGFTEYISNPEKDLHSLMASLIFPELKQYSHSEIKKNFKKERQFAKAATFSIPYGGNGDTISQNLSLSKSEGDRIYQEFMEEFPGLSNYFELAKKQVLKDGYVLINNISNRKSFVLNFEAFKAQERKMSSEFWELYREEKSKVSDLYLKELKPFISKYFSKKGDIERMGLNFRIQGTSADISKIAGVYMYEWIIKNNYWGIVKICVPLHDELFLECPEEIGELVKNNLIESMIKASKVFCKKIPFSVDAVIADHWMH